MRPLFLTPEVQAAATQLIAYAREHPVSVADLRRMKAGDLPAVGAHPQFAIEIPMGFRVVYSHEMQPVLGHCRHLSISVDREGKGPGVEAVNAIAKLFGFKEGIMSADHNWIEHDEDGSDHFAINLLQRVLPGDTT